LSGLTKILIVLQLVFAVALSVLLVLLVSRQENYRLSMDSANTRALGSAAALTDAQREQNNEAAQITALQSKVDTANADLSALRAKSTQDMNTASIAQIKLETDLAAAKAENTRMKESLSTSMNSLAAKDKELEALRPQVSQLSKTNGDIYRQLNESENKLRAAENAISKLQEAVATNNTPAGGAMAPSNGTGGQVQMLTSSGPATPQVNATINDVGNDKGRTLIQFPLGTRDGIQQNTRLFVYRGSSYVGDASVEVVTPDRSVAVVTKTKDGQNVQKGDIVSTLGQ